MCMYCMYVLLRIYTENKVRLSSTALGAVEAQKCPMHHVFGIQQTFRLAHKCIDGSFELLHARVHQGRSSRGGSYRRVLFQSGFYMLVCMYVFIYLCMNMCIYICVCASVPIRVLHVCMDVCMCVQYVLYVCVVCTVCFVCMYVCVCIICIYCKYCMYVCMCILSIYMYVYIYLTHICCMYSSVYACMYVSKYVCITLGHRCICMYVCIKCKHIYVCTTSTESIMKLACSFIISSMRKS